MTHLQNPSLCRFSAFSEISISVDRLPVFFKQRDNLFYPSWVFSLPTTILRMPYSLLEASIYSGIVYYVVGLAPQADRFFWCATILSSVCSPNRKPCT